MPSQFFTTEQIEEMNEFSDVGILPGLAPKDADEEDDGIYDEDADEEDDYEDDGGEPQDAAPNPVETAQEMTLEDLMAVDDTAPEWVYVQQWDKKVRLKGLTMNELQQIRRRSGAKQIRMAGRRPEMMNRLLLKSGLVVPRLDDAGVNILMERSAGVVLYLTDKIMEKSGMGQNSEIARERRFPRKR